MAEIVNPFMQSIGQMFASRAQHEYQKEAQINEDLLQQREKFRDSVGAERYGDINDLWLLVADIRNYINNQANTKLPKEQAIVLLDLLKSMDIEKRYHDLHPYEIPTMFHFRILVSELEHLVSN